MCELSRGHTKRPASSSCKPKATSIQASPEDLVILTAPDGTKQYAEASKLSDHPVLTRKDGMPTGVQALRIYGIEITCVEDFQEERQRRELLDETETGKPEQEAPRPAELRGRFRVRLFGRRRLGCGGRSS